MVTQDSLQALYIVLILALDQAHSAKIAYARADQAF